MAQFYNNAIEHEIEIALQTLYRANLDTKLVVARYLDEYIYTGKLVGEEAFKSNVSKLFSFKEYGAKAVKKQEAVNLKGLTKTFKEHGMEPITEFKPSYKSMEQFAKDYDAQVDKLVQASWAQLVNKAKAFDDLMDRRLNERSANN